MRDFIGTATSADIGSGKPEIAVLPIGSFEQHGDFLPLATDAMVAHLIAHRISSDYDLFLLPPITIGCSHEHSGFPGTVSISASTLCAIVSDVMESLRGQGINYLVVCNAHGGNSVLSNVVLQANASERCMILFPAREDWDQARLDSGCKGTTSEDMHAGELEVSLLLSADASLVRDTYRKGDHLAHPRPYLNVTGMRAYTETGVIGLPSEGTAEKGSAILESLSRSFAAHRELIVP